MNDGGHGRAHPARAVRLEAFRRPNAPCREGDAAALAKITGTARGEKLRQQAPDGLEDSSPRNFRSRRRRPRRPRTRSCAQRPWPPRLPRARSTRGTGPCGGAEMPLAASGRLALPYGPH